MVDPLTSTFPDRDTCLDCNMDASAPTLMSLPLELIEHILRFLLPDKDVLRLARGKRGRRPRPGIPSDKIEDDGSENIMEEPPPYGWPFDDEFRYDKQPVQTAVLRVNRLLHEEGSRILYGRTLKVDISTKNGNNLYDQRSSYFPIRDLPWAKLRNILIIVHAVQFAQHLKVIWEFLLLLCGYLVLSEPFIKKLHVIYAGEWDPEKIILPPGTDEFYVLYWTKSEVDALLFMLEPLRQLTMVRECKIQLPASVQENQGLADVVHRYIRGIKNEEPFIEKELLKGWDEYLRLRERLQNFVVKDRKEQEYSARMREYKRQGFRGTSGPNTRWVRMRNNEGRWIERLYQKGPTKRKKNKRKGRRKGRGRGRK